MKKIILYIVAFLCVTITFAQTAELPSGAGTVGDPYLITNLNNLYWATQDEARWDKYYRQTANIDASSTITWDAGSGFIPLGNESTYFTGEYDGQSHIIDGLFINRTGTNFVGMFGAGQGCNITNLGVINADVTGQNYVGIVVARPFWSTVTNCYCTGSATGTDYVGGLSAVTNSVISDCYSNCDVVGNDNVGGLIGGNYGDLIRNYALGTVTGFNMVGGFTGKMDATADGISLCYSNCTVIGTGTAIGGFIGSNMHDISNCFALGSVTGDDNVGGFVGYINSITIQYCYSANTVSSSNAVGGLVGYNAAGTILNSFWDTQVSGQGSSNGGTGKTTAEMKTETTFTDATWDFIGETTNGTDDFWGISGSYNNGYPYLTWDYTYTALTVNSHTPNVGATDVPISSNIEVVFSDNINAATLNGTSFNVEGSTSGVITGSFSGGGTYTITFTPDNDFINGETVTVTLSTAIESNDATPLESEYTWQFTIINSITPLTVSSHTPNVGATDVPISSNIEVIFSEPIDGTTLNGTSFSVEGTVSGVITGSFSGGGTNTITFTPDNDFINSETITVALSTNIESTGGTPLESEYTWNYTIIEKTNIIPEKLGRMVITPNDDGKNDAWIPPDELDFTGYELTIVNSRNMLVYQSSSHNNTWDGKLNGTPLPTGSYYIALTKDTEIIRGIIMIIN